MTVYTLPASSVLSMTALLAAMAAIGYVVRRMSAEGGRMRRWSTRALGVSLFGLALAPVSMARERILLDDHQLSDRGGLWFAPTERGLSLDRLASLDIVVDVASGTAGDRSVTQTWIATYRDGTTATLHAGDLLRASRVDIVARLRARGVAVHHGADA